jgi:hypothetical protein
LSSNVSHCRYPFIALRSGEPTRFNAAARTPTQTGSPPVIGARETCRQHGAQVDIEGQNPVDLPNNSIQYDAFTFEKRRPRRVRQGAFRHDLSYRPDTSSTLPHDVTVLLVGGQDVSGNSRAARAEIYSPPLAIAAPVLLSVPGSAEAAQTPKTAG